jgi:hypothetical protein
MHVDEERTLATLTTHRKIVDDLIAGGRGHGGSALQILDHQVNDRLHETHRGAVA